MKSKPKRCKQCGKIVKYPTIGWGNHMAMHQREALQDSRFARAPGEDLPSAAAPTGNEAAVERGKIYGTAQPTRPMEGNEAAGGVEL